MSVHVSVDVLSGGAAYLWDPPCDSWVSSVASLFFILGLLVASPIFFLLALVSRVSSLVPGGRANGVLVSVAHYGVRLSNYLQDFTSYAIVRTLGIEHAHPVSTKATLSITTTSPPSSSTPSPIGTDEKETAPSNPSSTGNQPKTQTTKRPKNISIAHAQSVTLDQVQPFFTTPGGANLELSGLFSPPESRTPSPPGSSIIHLDHQGSGAGRDGKMRMDGAQHTSDREGETPRAEAPPPASGTGNWRNRVDDAQEGALGLGVTGVNNDHVLLRRRKPVPEQSQ